MKTLRDFALFLRDCVRAALTGSRAYWLWVGLLGALLGVGLYAYVHQLRVGLGATGMRDQVSWAFYIGNFTFLVGVADAAVLVVIPAYVYKWKPAREVVVFGLLLAIAAVSMAATFVLVDIGHPERLWHLFPLIGSLNLPHSLLAWDVVALNSYLLLNIVIVLLVVGWLIGYIGFGAMVGSLIHVLLVLALIGLVYRLFSGRKGPL